MPYFKPRILVINSNHVLSKREVSSFFQAKIIIHDDYTKYQASKIKSVYYINTPPSKSLYRCILIFNFDLDHVDEFPEVDLFKDEDLNNIYQIEVPLSDINALNVISSYKLGLLEILRNSDKFHEAMCNCSISSESLHEININNGYLQIVWSTPNILKYKLNESVLELPCHKYRRNIDVTINCIEYPEDWFIKEPARLVNINDTPRRIVSFIETYLKGMKSVLLKKIMSMEIPVKWYMKDGAKVIECNKFNILDASYMSFKDKVLYPIHIISKLIKVQDICQCYVEGSKGGYFTRSFYDAGNEYHNTYNSTITDDKYIRRIPTYVQRCEFLRTDNCIYPNSETILYGIFELLNKQKFSQTAYIYNNLKYSSISYIEDYINVDNIEEVLSFIESIVESLGYSFNRDELVLAITEHGSQTVMLEFMKNIALKKLNISTDMESYTLNIPNYVYYTIESGYSTSWGIYDQDGEIIDYTEWGNEPVIYMSETEKRAGYLYNTNFDNSIKLYIQYLSYYSFTIGILIPKHNINVSTLNSILLNYVPVGRYIDIRTYKLFTTPIRLNSYFISPYGRNHTPSILETPMPEKFHRTFKDIYRFKSNKLGKSFVIFIYYSEMQDMFQIYKSIHSKPNTKVVTNQKGSSSQSLRIPRARN